MGGGGLELVQGGGGMELVKSGGGLDLSRAGRSGACPGWRGL